MCNVEVLRSSVITQYGNWWLVGERVVLTVGGIDIRASVPFVLKSGGLGTLPLQLHTVSVSSGWTGWSLTRPFDVVHTLYTQAC
jgi:hypothetical protein